MCVRSKSREIYIVDPSKKNSYERVLIQDISRISYEQNNQMTQPYHLFRIILGENIVVC